MCVYSKDVVMSVDTKGFLAYEGGATEWSAGANSHPGGAGTLTTKFSGITVNTGGLYTNHHLSFGITVYGSYWGEYQLTPISNNGGQITYYAVCHNDSNSDFCGYNNVKYLQDFAMEHI